MTTALRLLILPAVLPLVAGCTAQAWYDSARLGAEAQCQQQPAGAREECLSRVNARSYDDYRREREAVKQAP